MKLALVPTMGALHDGHRALLRAARADNDRVVMSLFVNPTQFGPGEDLASYPRDAERDREIAFEEGVDEVYEPTVEEMYPPGFDTTVSVADLGSRYEGAFRPGHFAAVATVVLKLLHQVRPAGTSRLAAVAALAIVYATWLPSAVRSGWVTLPVCGVSGDVPLTRNGCPSPPDTFSIRKIKFTSLPIRLSSPMDPPQPMKTLP